tara:strand:+ start:2377 stop:2979 length:603 start_codon:yes stop_codon:yes gene_type:complete
MKRNIIHTTIIVVIIGVLLSHIMTVKVYNKREYFNNKDKLNTSIPECDCLDSINNKDKLYTPCAVNIPRDNTIYNTYDNIKEDDKMKITGKYCFPIMKFSYDGIWNAEKQNINDTPNKQTLDWSVSNGPQINDVYCSDKFLIMPEKRMRQGDVIKQVEPDNKFYPSRNQINERLQDKCNKNSIFSNIIKTTLDKYTINGV